MKTVKVVKIPVGTAEPGTGRGFVISADGEIEGNKIVSSQFLPLPMFTPEAIQAIKKVLPSNIDETNKNSFISSVCFGPIFKILKGVLPSTKYGNPAERRRRHKQKQKAVITQLEKTKQLLSDIADGEAPPRLEFLIFDDGPYQGDSLLKDHPITYANVRAAELAKKTTDSIRELLDIYNASRNDSRRGSPKEVNDEFAFVVAKLYQKYIGQPEPSNKEGRDHFISALRILFKMSGIESIKKEDSLLDLVKRTIKRLSE
ncbi:MAG: hypothetical protein ACOZF0_15595 [Thermodesulfobacteriota bacterium]